MKTFLTYKKKILLIFHYKCVFYNLVKAFNYYRKVEEHSRSWAFEASYPDKVEEL